MIATDRDCETFEVALRNEIRNQLDLYQMNQRILQFDLLDDKLQPNGYPFHHAVIYLQHMRKGDGLECNRVKEYDQR